MTGHQLDRAVAHTGHERYRWLTSAANPDRDQREAYRRVVERIADGDPPPSAPPPVPLAVPLAESMRRMKLARECPHAGPASCGCTGLRACRRLAREVTHPECLACAAEEAP